MSLVAVLLKVIHVIFSCYLGFGAGALVYQGMKGGDQSILYGIPVAIITFLSAMFGVKAALVIFGLYSALVVVGQVVDGRKV